MDSEPDDAQIPVSLRAEAHQQRRGRQLRHERQLQRRQQRGHRLAEQAAERVRHSDVQVPEQLQLYRRK